MGSALLSAHLLIDYVIIRSIDMQWQSSLAATCCPLSGREQAYFSMVKHCQFELNARRDATSRIEVTSLSRRQTDDAD